MGLTIKTISWYKEGLVCPKHFSWNSHLDRQGWSIHIDIRINLKDEVRTLFEVSPPIWMSRKEAEKLKFKTTSYKELKKWLKKHKNELKDPIKL